MIMDLELETLSKDQLINLIMYMHRNSLTLNEAIVKLLEEYITEQTKNE